MMSNCNRSISDRSNRCISDADWVLYLHPVDTDVYVDQGRGTQGT